MIRMAEESLAEWIKSNMTIDERSVLEAHKEEVAKLIGITKGGGVVLLKDKSTMGARRMVVLYLVGKHMSRLAGYSDTTTARNVEISRALGMPDGTVGRCLRELEISGFVSKSQEGGYEIVLSSLATFFASKEEI